MKKTLIVLASMALVFVTAIAVVKADNNATFRSFTVGQRQVQRMTDPDNGNVCYIVLNDVTNGDEPISCVAGPQVAQPVTTKK